MIDTSKEEYWTGDCAEDITEWLQAYTEEDDLEVRPVICHSCGNDTFEIRCDQDEAAIQVKCTKCHTKKILLDCEEIWEEASPRLRRCPICKIGKSYNVSVGFLRRENGSVKWVYIGNRCTRCGTLGSYLDWKIDYEPTDEMEQNI